MTNITENESKFNNNKKINEAPIKYGVCIAILTSLIIFLSTSFLNLSADYFMSGYLEYFNITPNFQIPLNISISSIQNLIFSIILVIVSTSIQTTLTLYVFNLPILHYEKKHLDFILKIIYTYFVNTIIIIITVFAIFFNTNSGHQFFVILFVACSFIFTGNFFIFTIIIYLYLFLAVHLCLYSSKKRAINKAKNNTSPLTRKLVIFLMILGSTPFFVNFLASFFFSVGNQSAIVTKEFVAFKIDKSIVEIDDDDIVKDNHSSIENISIDNLTNNTDTSSESISNETDDDDDTEDTYIVIQKINDSEYLCLKLVEKEIPFENSNFIITSLIDKNLYMISDVTKSENINK